MRVISGALKGREIKGYNIEGTRPTMDRVKKSVFDSLQMYIKDSIVLDLFAGSGNLGIEAISNGASKCYFVDYNKECYRVIKENINNFNLTNKSRVLLMDYEAALRNFYHEQVHFDLILVDPPYKLELMSNIINLVIKYNLLNPNGLLVLEFQSDILQDSYQYLHVIKKKKYGDKYIYIYQYKDIS